MRGKWNESENEAENSEEIRQITREKTRGDERRGADGELRYRIDDMRAGMHGKSRKQSNIYGLGLA